MKSGTTPALSATEQALALQRQGRLEDADALYRRERADGRIDAALLNNHGNLLRRLGRPEEAEEAFTRALALRPDSAAILANRAAARIDLAASGRGQALREAAEDAARAETLDPALPEAPLGLGAALRAAGRLKEAAAAFRRVLALDPDRAEAQHGLGSALLELGRPRESAGAWRRALDADPSPASAWCGLAAASHAMGLREDALAACDEALGRDPECWEAMLRACVARLPLVAADEADRVSSRAAYVEALETLAARLGRAGPEQRWAAAAAIGMAQPFMLPALGENDRDAQAVWGRLVHGLMAETFPRFAKVPATRPRRPGEPLRVAIVSAYFRRHSIWKIPLRGWLSGLDRDRFAVSAYHLGTAQGEQTESAKRLAARLVEGPRPTAAWAELIAEDRPDIVLYPEIGMDAATLRLAALRLAPVQAAFGGHPVTTGLPSIDYHLSSDLMEPADGQAHYTETLVRLPNLGVDYQPLPVRPDRVERAELGLRQDEILFWCGQSLHKFLPAFDRVFAAIAAEIPRCRLLFVANGRAEAATRTFERRLQRAFAERGLDHARHCLMLPEMPEARYQAVSGLCDIFLDPIGWSGNNTAMEAAAQAMPIVTLPGTTMRGRHAFAILARLGVEGTVARDADDYVRIAAALARDGEARIALRRRMAAARHRLYGDRDCARALGDFLEGAAPG